MLKIIYASLLIRMIHAYPLLKTRGSRHVNSESRSLSLGENTCPFPYDDLSLAPIGSQTNQGWLLTSYPCTPNSYCSYFCNSGYFVNPDLIDGYNSQNSMFGRVECKSSGDIDNSAPLCIPGSPSAYLLNLMDEPSTYCQKLGSEENILLASNNVPPSGYSPIVLGPPSDPPSSYYINPPDGNTNARCVLGNSRDNKGLWSPYILVLNRDESDGIHAQLGWNPRYTNDAYWGNVGPNWGIKVTCKGPTCDKKCCVIDPEKHKVNEYGDGANDRNEGSLSCYLNAPKNSKVLVTLFLRGDSNKEHDIPDFLKLDLSDPQLSESDQNDESLDGSDSSGLKEPQEDQQVNEKKSENGNTNENVEGNSHSSINNEGTRLTTHDTSSGDVDILLIKLSDKKNKNIQDPVASFAKLANDPSQEPEDMNCPDSDGLTSESCLNKMAKTCQYILEKIRTHLNQMHSLFKQNDQAIQSNDHMQHNGISPTGEISSENSASNTLRRGAHWSLIIITGIIMFM